jgi:hypothetical protein
MAALGYTRTFRGVSRHVRFNPRPDIQMPVSVIVLISSVSPPEADVAAVGRDSLELTRKGHSIGLSTSGKIRAAVIGPPERLGSWFFGWSFNPAKAYIEANTSVEFTLLCYCGNGQSREFLAICIRRPCKLVVEKVTEKG